MESCIVGTFLKNRIGKENIYQSRLNFQSKLVPSIFEIGIFFTVYTLLKLETHLFQPWFDRKKAGHVPICTNLAKAASDPSPRDHMGVPFIFNILVRGLQLPSPFTLLFKHPSGL
jgi:hypothetical protein